MAWKASTTGELEWDTEINGLTWYRRGLVNYTYLYLIFDEDAVPEPLRDAAGRMEWRTDSDHFYNVKTAAEWAVWEHAATLWSPELAREEEEEKLARSVVSIDRIQVDDDDGVSLEQDVADVQPPQQHNVQATRLADPRLESARPAYYAHRGAYSWSVKVLVEPHNQASWVIQKVQASGPDEQETFWEAFPVGANKSEADFQDIYMSPVSQKSNGTRTVRGLMQHFVFAGGVAPPGMTSGGSEGADREGLSTATAPPFWADSGTPHDLDITWGAIRTEVTTVPASGTPEKRDLRDIQYS